VTVGTEANWAVRQKSKASPAPGEIYRKRQFDGRQSHGPSPHIATVTTAVANGNLTKKITVDEKASFLELRIRST